MAEVFNGKLPEYVHNPRVNYENVVLQEHASIISGLRDTALPQVYIETQARLFIGICLKDRAHQFIEDRVDKYSDEEGEKISGIVFGDDYGNTVRVRTWVRLLNEALAEFIKRYKVDGSRAGIAVINTQTPVGTIVEATEDIVDFSDAEAPR
jgi:hypothetical protein